MCTDKGSGGEQGTGAGPGQRRAEAGALWDMHLDDRHSHAPAIRGAG